MLKNPWTSYVTRNFSAIKAAVNARMDTIVPELTDKSPSNMMQVLIDVWAGVGELLNYYTDTTARELYVPTALRFTSILKLAELAGYNGQAAVPSRTSITVTTLDANGDPFLVTTDFPIAAGLTLQDANGNTWTVDVPTEIREGTGGVRVSVAQWEALTGIDLSDLTDGTVNQALVLPSDYMEGTLSLTISGDVDTWTRVNAFGYYGPNDKVFLTKLQSDGLVYLVFGDGVHGQIPTAGQTVTTAYHSTQGDGGNAEQDTITVWTPDLVVPGATTVETTNPEASYGGLNIQGIEEVRRSIPLSQRTLDRAVTEKDYEDVAVLTPGIRAAKVSYDCGPRINIYLVGEGGGNPDQGLLDLALNEYILPKSMVTLAVATIASGESHVRGIVEVTGRYREKASVITQEVEAALFLLYSPQSTKINQPVRTSDVISTIDNVPSVDFLTLTLFYVQPYLRPSNVAAVLNYTIEVGAASVANVTWRLVCTDISTPGAEVFSIRKQGFDTGSTVTVGGAPTVVAPITITLTDSGANVNVNDYWEFIVSPANSDVELVDNSIPVIFPGDFEINVTETYINQ